MAKVTVNPLLSPYTLNTKQVHAKSLVTYLQGFFNSREKVYQISSEHARFLTHFFSLLPTFDIGGEVKNRASF